MGALPEPVEALARVGGELLVDLVGARPVAGEDPRARHPEVLPALGQQLRPVGAAEGDQRLRVALGGVERDLDAQPPVGQRRARPLDLDLARRARRRGVVPSAPTLSAGMRYWAARTRTLSAPQAWMRITSCRCRTSRMPLSL